MSEENQFLLRSDSRAGHQSLFKNLEEREDEERPVRNHRGCAELYKPIIVFGILVNSLLAFFMLVV